MTQDSLPPFPLTEWEDTKNTLHLFVQIIGKIRLALVPRINHWWHVPLYISARGLSTGPMPYENRTIDIEFDFIDHQLIIRSSEGIVRSLPLTSRSVAEFYHEIRSMLGSLDVHISMIAKPYGIPITEPFASDSTHASYDPIHVHRFWNILQQVEAVLQEYRGEFIGKCSPVHFFWHSFDLAVTRFSGRPAPANDAADKVTREAYSHEVISCGFWVGDAIIPEPAFYLYAHPEPAGLADEPLYPAAAFWSKAYGGSMALLLYKDLRNSESPRETLLKFLESGYQAGARLAGWEREALERKLSIGTDS